MNNVMQSEFARTKEAAIWGILYGFQQEQIAFRMIHMVDAETAEMQTLILRWHKNNPPTIKQDHFTCMLTFNMVPTHVSVEFSNIAVIVADGGVSIAFKIEKAAAPEPEETKPKLKLV